jgi:glycosyltransferase involved in cell wall biosynthesis
LRIGFLGRLEPIKGLEVLLAAAAQLEPGSVRVLVGGTGSPNYEALLKARYAGPAVEFLGHVAPGAFFDGIDVLVVPSLVEEALGRVVHEALQAGVPIIGSEIGGIPEMIRQGDTGFLVPAGDVQALSGLLMRILKTPPDWEAMSTACLAEAQRFTYERISAQYRAAWTAAIAAREAARLTARTPATARIGRPRPASGMPAAKP